MTAYFLRRSVALAWGAAALLACAPGCTEPELQGEDAGGRTDAAAGPDGGGGGTCAAASDCDDGLYCNGPESCDPSAGGADARGCLAGSAPCEAAACDEGSDACDTSCSTDADGDGHVTIECGGDDCDDADADAHPGNAEVCDAEGHDEDCDAATFGARDADGDGVVDARCCNGDTCGRDCRDFQPSVSPTSPELCDGVDNDCDGAVDEGATVSGYADADRDGSGDSSAPMEACPGTSGFVADGGDCDDADPTVHPSAAELCDGVDNDCDDTVDESTSSVTWYEDDDGDGFGAVGGRTLVACAPPVGWSLLPIDCDDTRAEVSPVAAETCNGRDDDCDGRPDYAVGAGDLEDDDGDGFADAACGGDDCDDLEPTVHPGAAEVADGRDNDCDPETADGSASSASWYRDADGDGWGDPTMTMDAAEQPAGYVSRGRDCDDTDGDVHPDALEECDDGQDDDCDGRVDESAASRPYYADGDDDGFGAGEAVWACARPSGAVLASGDCDDAAAAVNPGAAEVCNGVDDDCDGATDGAEASAACTLSAASSVCEAGSCAIETCDAGYDSCDGADATGCETALGTDTDCAACGDSCGPFETCGASGCEPVSGWSISGGSSLLDAVSAFAANDAGDIFVAGSHEADFTLAGVGPRDNDGDRDAWLARVDRAGDVTWLVRLGGSGYDAVTDLALLPSGDVVIGGAFTGTVTFGAFGDLTAPSDGRHDGFVARLDASDGAFTWARQLNSADGNVSRVGTDSAGWIYGAGVRSSDSDIGCGSVTAESVDGIVFRLNEDGGCDYAFRGGGAGSDSLTSMAVSDTHGLFVGGRTASASASFGGPSVSRVGSWDAVIASYDLDGTYRTEWRLPGTGRTNAAQLSVDPDGNVYLAGEIEAGGSTDLGGGSRSAGTNHRGFVASYQIDGTYRWDRPLVSSERTLLCGLDATRAGVLYVGGFFAGTVDFGRSHSASAEDILVAGLSPADGSVRWSEAYGAGANDYVCDVEAVGQSHFLFGGVYGATVDFGFGEHTAVGDRDAFLVLQQDRPTSCAQILAADPAAASGRYPIDPDGPGPEPTTQVYCDMEREGGGWTLVAVMEAEDRPAAFDWCGQNDYAFFRAEGFVCNDATPDPTLGAGSFARYRSYETVGFEQVLLVPANGDHYVLSPPSAQDSFVAMLRDTPEDTELTVDRAGTFATVQIQSGAAALDARWFVNWNAPAGGNDQNATAFGQSSSYFPGTCTPGGKQLRGFGVQDATYTDTCLRVSHRGLSTEAASLWVR